MALKLLAWDEATNRTKKTSLDPSSLTGLNSKNSCRAATTEALPAYTYDNGSSGAGATLTGSSDGALADQDGVTLVLNDRLLVKDESGGNQPYNGIYTVTQVGDGSNPYILTRASDFDGAAEIGGGEYTFVLEGTTQSDTGWVVSSPNTTATIGTTNIVWTQFTGTGSVSIGSSIQSSTAGSILFIDTGSVLEEDNDNLFWDNTGKYLGIGTSTPATELDIAGQITSYDAADTDRTSQIAIYSDDTLKYSDLYLSRDSGNFYFNLLVNNGSGESSINLVSGASSTTDITMVSSGKIKRGKDGTNFVEEDYIDSTTLTADTTAVASNFTYSASSYQGVEITYTLSDGSDIRTGTIRLANSTSAVSITDTYVETANVGVTWTAAISSGNVELSYTADAGNGNRTMRADIKRLRA